MTTHCTMDDFDHVDEYLTICRRIYERMFVEGTWPWFEDSTESEDMVDSGS